MATVAARLAPSPSQPVNSPPQPQHLAFVDGLRGYAALYVLLLHSMMWGGWWPRVFPDPKLAVDVFMVVSGYLMVFHWNSREYGPGFTPQAVSRFLLRRFFRIAPLYYLTIAFAYLAGPRYTAGLGFLAAQSHRLPISFDPAAAATCFTPANLFMHLTFLYGLTTNYHWPLPDWSISLEMQFYLAFPLLLLAFRKVGYLSICAAALPLGILSLHAWPFFSHTPSLLTVKLPIFFIGMLAAEAHRTFKTHPPAAMAILFLTPFMALLGDARHPAVLIAVAGIMFFLASAREIHVLRHTLLWVARFLGNRWTHFLADMSYGVYLVHFFFLSAYGWLLIEFPALHTLRHFELVALLIAINVAGSYGCAYFLHHSVEKPAIELGKRLIIRPRNKPARVLVSASL